HEIDALRSLRDRHAALSPNPVAAQVERDSIQPRGELRLPPKPRERAESPKKRFLADVTRVLFAANRAIREGVDGPLPSEDELVEAVGIAADRSRDELFVGPRHASAELT